MDKSVNNMQEPIISLIEGTESDIETVSSDIRRVAESCLQPDKMKQYALSMENLGLLLHQLIATLKEDVDKLWISELSAQPDSAKASDSNNITLLQQKRLWGEKETVLSSLTKLVTLLDKVIAIDVQLKKLSDDTPEKEDKTISKDDKAIIDRYFLIRYQQGETNENSTKE